MPPNVILCISDQLRAFALGCYGEAAGRTPNLDQLAREGVRFDIACTNNPLCTPARACLHSGQYSRTANGMRGNVGNFYPVRNKLRSTTLAEAFKAGGYATALIGTWHQEPSPGMCGFDDFYCPSPIETQYRDPLMFDNSFEARVHEGWQWDILMERARRFLEGRDRGRPFFMCFCIDPPHMPLAEAPERVTKRYGRGDVVLRPNVYRDGQMAYDEHWFKIYLHESRYLTRHEPEAERLPEGFDLRDLAAMYGGMVSLVDEQVGLLRAALEESDSANTLLAFTADHGDCLGSHGCFNKGRMYEEAIRVPLIYHWPEELEGRVVSRQVASHVDLMPTLLSLAGLDVPKSVQGQDLSNVVRGDAAELESNAAFVEFIQAGPGDAIAGGVGIRTPTQVYAVGVRDASLYGFQAGNDDVTVDPLMAYDLENDPYELTNLASTGDGFTSLRERLLQWHRQTPWLAT